MKALRHLLLAAATIVALSAWFAPAPASAANIELCAPNTASAAAGPRRVVNPVTTTAYSLNGVGCAIFASADVGYFQSQGFLQPGPVFSIVYDTGTAATTSDFVVGTLPAGAYLREIIVSNSTATSVTGGIGFGTTANATDVVTALTCGASCLTHVTDANLKLRVFSTTAAQAIHAAAITTWQSARVVITLVYGYF